MECEAGLGEVDGGVGVGEGLGFRRVERGAEDGGDFLGRLGFGRAFLAEHCYHFGGRFLRFRWF